MRLFGLEITRARTTAPLAPIRGSGGWFPVVREPYTGAWQNNQELRADSILSNQAAFSCTTLIASDIGKLALRLVAQDLEGIWHEAESAAFSPVLRRPNRYQNRIKFVEQWIVSKLTNGNTYALKQRDERRVVTALYILDPSRVTPLVATDGSVYYELKRDDLAGIPDNPDGRIIVPASEIIHDLYIALFHPLVGVSPIFACGLPALQALKIQETSTAFFGNGSNPGGILTAPGAILDETAKRLKDYWDSNFSGANVGKVAVLGDGLKYEGMSVSAVDSQLIEQLKWTAEMVCSCYHVPGYLIGVTPAPPYANAEPLMQQYYSQCIQSLLTSFELCLDEGLELPKPYGTEFDIDDLIYMDTATRTKAAADAIGAGALSPDEARRKYFGVGKVPGGDSPYLQQQYFSLAALAARDAADPFAKPTPAPPALPPAVEPAPEPDDAAVIKALAPLLVKDWTADYAA